MHRSTLRIVLALLATVRVAAPIDAQQPLRVPYDTRLDIKLSTNLSTKTAQVGDVVAATLLRHRPPLSPAERLELPVGSPVIGQVDYVRRGERGKSRSELRLTFTTVGGGTIPAYSMTSVVLIVPARFRLTGPTHDITVRVMPRSEYGEAVLFGVPFGAGMGVLVGRNGKTAMLGAAAAFLSMYLPPLIHSTNNPWADVELKAGDVVVLHVIR